MSNHRAKPALPPEPPLSQDEIHQWRKAYRAALKGMLAAHNGKRMAAPGAGHIAGGHADAAIYEERRRFGVAS